MKKPAFLFFPLAALALALSSCASKTTAAETTPAGQKAKVSKNEPKPKAYPLKKCLVTGDALDEMDERVSTVYKGQTFEFCCKPCLKKFNKNPEKYLKELEKANR